ncbi:glycosyltransferase family 4 protein [Flavobacterium sp. H122]|uniref:glycosyltransferase family 4 protein n=1 Tax=Flavobacterium sp. H122 TaxID=2529860 RepID=UPI0010AA0891|nr:glycosyltransferase family 4 protein [Flavobacterium sp. H122]
MKILVVVDSIDVNDSSGSKANVALIQNLAACGFEVCVLHYTQKNIILDAVTCVAVPEKKWNYLYVLSRTERLFTRLTKISLNKYLEQWFGFSFTFFNDSYSIATAVKKHKDFQPDLILTLSKGASFRPHHALLKVPEFHNKWMAYVHDPYPFHFYPRPYNWIQPGYAQKERFFRTVSGKAEYSAFPSQLLKEWMGSYFDNFLKTGIIIPHQVEKNTINDIPAPDYFDSTKFNLLHAGNLMKQRSPIPLIKAYKKFLEAFPDAEKQSQLLLLGPADFYEEELINFQKEITSLHVENRNVPFKEVLALQEKVSVNIILESKSEISPFLPGKFPHCIAADKPILLLSPYYSETRRLLGENYSYWAEADDVVKIKTKIEKLYLNWKENSNQFLNRKDLEKYCSNEHVKKELFKLFNNTQNL